MNPLRFAVFAGIAGVALWGLFRLLDNLSEPGLLRTQKATVIKGCDKPDSDEARTVCPQLQCQKALIDGKQVPYTLHFTVSVDQIAGAVRFVGGSIVERAPDDKEGWYACVLENGKVAAAKVLDGVAFGTLAGQQGGWQL